MRRSGKTTKVVDLAIKLLFENGEISILNDTQVFDESEQWRRGLNLDQVERMYMLTDPDVFKGGNVQAHLLHCIRRRLNSEHRGQVINSGYKFIVKK